MWIKKNWHNTLKTKIKLNNFNPHPSKHTYKQNKDYINIGRTHYRNGLTVRQEVTNEELITKKYPIKMQKR